MKTVVCGVHTFVVESPEAAEVLLEANAEWKKHGSSPLFRALRKKALNKEYLRDLQDLYF